MESTGARSKLVVRRQGSKKNSAILAPTEVDLTIAKAIFDLQSSSSELGAELRMLQLYGAKEVELPGGRRAIVLIVPVPQLKAWRKIQLRVVRELEKKFSDRAIAIIAFRRILPKPKRGVRVKQIRPVSRTLTAVHDAWLEDLVYPTEIVGKRTRVKTDGSRIIRVFLDAKDQTALEGKIDTFASIYHELTGKAVVFDFPITGGAEEGVSSASTKAKHH